MVVAGQAPARWASQLEDDPLFNAGCGSVLNEHGRVEMDAGIMDGRDLAAGAVAALSNIANPVQLARLVVDGNCASGFTTKQMVHGCIEHGGATVCRF